MSDALFGLPTLVVPDGRGWYELRGTAANTSGLMWCRPDANGCSSAASDSTFTPTPAYGARSRITPGHSRVILHDVVAHHAFNHHPPVTGPFLVSVAYDFKQPYVTALTAESGLDGARDIQPTGPSMDVPYWHATYPRTATLPVADAAPARQERRQAICHLSHLARTIRVFPTPHGEPMDEVFNVEDHACGRRGSRL